MAFLGRCSTASSPASLLSLQPQFQVFPPLPTGFSPQLYLFFHTSVSPSLVHSTPTPTSSPLTEQYILTNPSLPCSKPAPMNGMLSKERSSSLTDAFIPSVVSMQEVYTTYKYRLRGPPLICSCFEICPPVGLKCLPFATQITAFVCSLLFLCPETSFPAKQDLHPSSHLSYQSSYACITCTIYPGHVGKFSNHYEVRSLIHPYLDHRHA